MLEGTTVADRLGIVRSKVLRVINEDGAGDGDDITMLVAALTRRHALAIAPPDQRQGKLRVPRLDYFLELADLLIELGAGYSDPKQFKEDLAILLFSVTLVQQGIAHIRPE